MNEHQKHIEAFEAYYALGKDRSLPKLLANWATLVPTWTGKPPSLNTLKNWSVWFGWQDRILLLAKNISKGTEKRLEREEINARVDAIKNTRQAVDALRTLIATGFSQDEEGRFRLRDDVKIKSAKDLLAVAAAIVRCELDIQKLIEPEETVNVQGATELKYETIPPEIAKKLGDELARRSSQPNS